MNNLKYLLPLPLLFSSPLMADIVHLDDTIINGSACVGFDCVNGESFGSDTLRLKENNLRIHFNDSSSSASFPSNDWRIVINDSSNGGGNYFAIEDSTAGRQVFRVDAGAPANALIVDAQGDVGIGTSTPAVNTHIVDGNTPTVRLEQNGTSGFTPQTWDIGSNEANFFIRDVTNGSKLSFRIRPGAPESSIDIAANGNVGIGTSSPDSNLDIQSSSNVELRLTGTGTVDASWVIKNNQDTGRLTFYDALGTTVPLKIASDAVENLVKIGIPNNDQVRINGDLVIDNTANSADWIIKNNPDTGRLTLSDDNGSTVPFKIASNASENLLRLGTQNTNEVTITGNLVVNGTITPDYVFESSYQLESIPAHTEFMWAHKHLPSVSPAKTNSDGLGTVNIATRSQQLLEELEKAHIYISQLHNKIDKIHKRLANLEQSKH